MLAVTYKDVFILQRVDPLLGSDCKQTGSHGNESTHNSRGTVRSGDFHKDLLIYSKINKDDKHTDSRTHRQKGDPISLLLFFQNKKSRLKMMY
jgi:hypothetical protein